LIEETFYLSIAEYERTKLIRWYDPSIYEALEVLDDLATKSEASFGFSFRDNQTPAHHFHTALTLEYDSDELPALANAISDFPQAVFMIPTRHKKLDCHLLGRVDKRLQP